MAIGKENLAGLTTLSVPDTTDPHHIDRWREISNPPEMVDALMKEHSCKYHQTDGTPPMSFPVISQLGRLGTGQAADNILAGKYTCLPGTDDYSAMLLQFLSKVDPTCKDIPVGISGQDLSAGWNKVKEKTSSGGNVCHFGHCKAMAKD